MLKNVKMPTIVGILTFMSINVKMPTIVGILTFMSRINYQFLRFEPEFSTNFDCFSIYEQLKFHAQLENGFITFGSSL